MNKSAAAGVMVAMLAGSAQAQINGNIEYLASVKPEQSYLRGNATYTVPFLPIEVKGFTFAEYYQDANPCGKGYLFKTSLDSKVVDVLGVDISARFMMVNSSELIDRAAIGVKASTSVGPVLLSAYFVPGFMNTDGHQTQNKNAAGYFALVKLPEGFKLSCFGEVNLNAAKGPEWGYGEICLEKNLGSIYNKLKGLDVFIAPAIRKKASGSVKTDIEFRTGARLNF